MQTDLAIGPAGDVWVMNNWQDIDSCFGIPPEALSTRCGGQGVTIFFGMAKPVRAHVLLCMLAYYLQWHMRRCLAPMLFDDPDPAAREAQRTSPVAKAEPSPAARRKAARKPTDPADGEPLPVHSFHTLLGDLATLTRNVVRLGRDRLTAIFATPTRTQQRALDLLGLTLTA